jgi:hypothetical protein
MLEHTHITYIRFLHIHIAICVPSLVEIAPGVPELCPDIQTSIFIDTDRGYLPVDPYDQHKPGADVPHLISVLPGFLAHS